MSHFLREFFMSLGDSRLRQLVEAKRSTARERRQQERLQLMQTQKKSFFWAEATEASWLRPPLGGFMAANQLFSCANAF